MAVKIRLARRGSKKRPFYHIVVANSRDPRDGNFIEKVGAYNPMLEKGDEKKITLVTERIKYWLSTGAQPTDRVARFLGDAGLMEKYTIKTQPKKSVPKAKAQERAKQLAEKAAAAAEAKKQAEEQAKAEFEDKKQDSTTATETATETVTESAPADATESV